MSRTTRHEAIINCRGNPPATASPEPSLASTTDVFPTVCSVSPHQGAPSPSSNIPSIPAATTSPVKSHAFHALVVVNDHLQDSSCLALYRQSISHASNHHISSPSQSNAATPTPTPTPAAAAAAAAATAPQHHKPQAPSADVAAIDAKAPDWQLSRWNVRPRPPGTTTTFREGCHPITPIRLLPRREPLAALGIWVC
ncbi:hypothetical protein CPLU01_06221 [Colletotrichum plurivorum]|uniref:Uncharacterized protein n=1 Tax=Colletotrichum plurivorum TaxID=2175906 RepID=A0A8H6NH97_9PEZI|nr:hypothetical protein CPLU01_06221 [Colletotrichum plurivorum]